MGKKREKRFNASVCAFNSVFVSLIFATTVFLVKNRYKIIPELPLLRKGSITAKSPVRALLHRQQTLKNKYRSKAR
jgi:hypothetical protein